MLLAAAVYFALVFGTGFVLGTLRVLVVVPLVGVRAAELIESPFMLLATTMAARFVVRRFCRGFDTARLLGVGLIAIGVLLVAEVAVGIGLRGMSFAEVFTDRDPVSGTVYYGLLVLFAVMPWVVGRRGGATGGRERGEAVYQCTGRPRPRSRSSDPSRSSTHMTPPLIARRPRHRSRLPYLVAGLVCLTLATLLGLAIYFRFTGHDMTGLEGVWRAEADTDKRQGYDFQPDGTVSAWNGKEKSWVNTVGWDATWRRKGNEITIKTDRNWDFVGKLEGDTLRGTMTIRSYPDWTETTAEMVWRKE